MYHFIYTYISFPFDQALVLLLNWKCMFMLQTSYSNLLNITPCLHA